MKIALAQLGYHIGNFELNSQKIINAIRNAKSNNADLVVFAELAVCGYPPRDFLEFSDFIDKCLHAVEEIAKECNGIAAIVGAPSKNPRVEGKDLFNSAYFLADGKIKQIYHKALLPNYDVFDEYRYFEPGRDFSVIMYKGKKIALTVCEDLWDIDDNLLYNIWPMGPLSEHGADFAINIAASPFDHEQSEKRKKVIQFNAKKYRMPFFYVNHTGAQTELIFDGGSMVSDKEGNIVKRLSFFKEDIQFFDTDKLTGQTTISAKYPENKIEKIYGALVLGIRDYFTKLGFKKAIVGLSGGIDSSVTVAITAEALGNQNVISLLMPSRFSSDHSVKDSENLVRNLESPYEIISIEEAFKSFETMLSPFFQGLPFDVTEENIQARVRAILLMGFSNKFGYILLNTSNKSEAAVGYGTLYGDMAGGLSVLGDVYKTQVYELAEYINRDKEIIPRHIITKPPSAELRPDQKDSDSLPDYEILDRILQEYIENRKGPQEIINLGYDPVLVERTLKLVNISEFKRHQTPPILRVSPKAFGMGRRMPIVAKYLS